jgi:hypothetical protein
VAFFLDTFALVVVCFDLAVVEILLILNLVCRVIKTYEFIFYLKKRFTGNNNKQDNFKGNMPSWQSLSLDLGKLNAHSKV